MSPLLVLGAAGAALVAWALASQQTEQAPDDMGYDPFANAATKWVTGYSNRTPFSLQVKDVGNSAWLETNAADAFLSMQAAAAAQGVYLIAGSGFRSMEEQTSLYNKWKAGLYNVPAVAVPGTSNHQNGSAVDVARANRSSVGYGSLEFNWLSGNAATYGFSWDEGRSVNEPWHWRYVG